jgi:hypothetical protein
MCLLYPKFRLSLLPTMIGYALLSALLAGFYGVIHDQITYTISPEYFTRLKFAQFHYADFGLPSRVFVGEIGFLATWWLGFIAGWFLARVTVPSCPALEARRRCFQGFAMIFACAIAASAAGFGLGLRLGPDADLSNWRAIASRLGVLDLRSFVCVAYIHNAGYLGGLIGLIAAIIYLRRPRTRTAPPDGRTDRNFNAQDIRSTTKRDGFTPS